MAVLLRANTELVAVAWLASAPGIDPAQVATTLPANSAVWAESGFIQVGPVVGGSPNPHIPKRTPVVQVDCWAVNPTSGKPKWSKAINLAETIRAAYEQVDHRTIQRTLTLLPGYPQARVTSTYFAVEPRRVPGDSGAYARYQADMIFDWIELGSDL